MKLQIRLLTALFIILALIELVLVYLIILSILSQVFVTTKPMPIISTYPPRQITEISTFSSAVGGFALFFVGRYTSKINRKYKALKKSDKITANQSNRGCSVWIIFLIIFLSVITYLFRQCENKNNKNYTDNPSIHQYSHDRLIERKEATSKNTK